MSKTEKLNEGQVFMQELDDDELDAVCGGELADNPNKNDKYDEDQYNCTEIWTRDITGGSGFPNCAATVEDGSWCRSNDACHSSNSVKYRNMHDCGKAWA